MQLFSLLSSLKLKIKNKKNKTKHFSTKICVGRVLATSFTVKYFTFRYVLLFTSLNVAMSF